MNDHEAVYSVHIKVFLFNSFEISLVKVTGNCDCSIVSKAHILALRLQYYSFQRRPNRSAIVGNPQAQYLGDVERQLQLQRVIKIKDVLHFINHLLRETPSIYNCYARFKPFATHHNISTSDMLQFVVGIVNIAEILQNVNPTKLC